MHKRALAATGLLTLAFLAFSNSFDAALSLDSATLVLKDPRIREASVRNLGLIFQHSYYWPNGEAGLYRPLTTLSFLLNYSILGDTDRAFGYHAINFLLHGLNVLLVYALALRLSKREVAAFLIAALWAVHPVQTEAVTNVAGRADLLAALGVLGGFFAYLKSIESRGWLAGVAVMAALGAFAKESAAVLPGVILLYELVLGRRRQAALYGILAAAAPVGVLLLARHAVLTTSELPYVDNPIAGADFFTGRLTALAICGRYLALLLWPAHLSADYSYAQIPMASGSAEDWAAWLGVLALSVIVVWLWRRERNVFFFACFAILTFAPVANVVFVTGSIMAERFLYLPSMGFIAALVLGMYALKPRLALPVLCAIAAALAVRTYARNADWSSELSIVSAGVRTSPNSFKLHARLSELLFQSGGTSGEIAPAIEEAEKSIAILDPLPDSRNQADVYRTAGGYYLVQGDLLRQRNQDAAQAYARSLQLLERSAAIAKAVHAQGADPSVVYQMLSAAYQRTGQAGKAADAAAEALMLHPQTADAYRQIAYTLLAADRRDAAVQAVIQGTLSGFGELSRDTVDLYLEAFRGSCAITNGEINQQCPLVRKHFCAASAAAGKPAQDCEIPSSQ